MEAAATSGPPEAPITRIEFLDARRLGLGKVFERTRDAVVVGDAASGRIGLWNQAAVELFGYTADEGLQMLIEDIVPEEMKEAHRKGLARFAAGTAGPLVTSGEPVEVPAIKRDGSRIWVEMSLTPLSDDHESGRYVMAIIRNVTDRKRLEDDLRQTRDDLERRNHQLLLLNDLGDMLNGCTDIDEAGSVVSQVMPRLFPGLSGRLFLFAPSRNLLDGVATWGTDAPTDPTLIPTGCWALRRGRTHRSGSDGSIGCPHLPSEGSWGVCVPMVAQAETVGLLHLCAPAAPEILSAEDAIAQLAAAVAEHLSLALANFRLRETLRNQSIRDPLTGLYNRRYLDETIERFVSLASRHDVALSVVAMDIDHFKTFNDTQGHGAGDEVLRVLGTHLNACTRSEDVVCRAGGEEFILLMPYAGLAEATQRVDDLLAGVRLLRVGRTPEPGRPALTVSAGLAAFGAHGRSSHGLLKAADDALYRAKRTGRDRLVIAEA